MTDHASETQAKSCLDCDLATKARQLCGKHYDKRKADGTLPPYECNFRECSDPVRINRAGYSTGFCALHLGVTISVSRYTGEDKDEHIERVLSGCKGGRRIDKTGYIFVRTETAWIAEHRAVMQDSLGRELVIGESVHHVNGDRGDNRIENLELWYSAQPYGQRVPDLIRYLTTHHAAEVAAHLSAQQPEPGQLDEGKAAEAGEFSDCPRCDRHLRAVQHFKSRAEKAEAERDDFKEALWTCDARAHDWEIAHRMVEAERDDALAMAAQSELDRVEEKDKADRTEAERDAILDELRSVEVALSQRCAHSIGQTREAHHRAWDDVTGLLDRHTPEG